MHVEPLVASESAPALAARLCDAPGLVWLDGEAPHADGRWSYLGVDPVERIERYGGQLDPLAAFAEMEPGPGRKTGGFETHPDVRGDAAEAIELASVPRWIGFVAYDAAWCDRRG